MTQSFLIAPATTQADIADAAILFEHYASTLPIDLGYQDFRSELSGLPGKYAAPTGAILLARNEHRQAVGCVGIRPLPITGSCEMKRLFTLPSTRGIGLGRALTQAAITCASSFGCKEIKLDTLSTMQAAVGLYERIGFARVEPYYVPTPPETIFMALRL